MTDFFWRDELLRVRISWRIAASQEFGPPQEWPIARVIRIGSCTGDRALILNALIGTCQRHGLNPHDDLKDNLTPFRPGP